MDPDKTIRVEETLVRALDMYSTETTRRRLASYVVEQLSLPRARWEYADDLACVEFLAALAQALTPPDDRRMGFRDRPGMAARDAVPHRYGAALDLMVAMGWGNTHLSFSQPTPREIGEELKRELDRRARGLALQLLETWEKNGTVYRV